MNTLLKSHYAGFKLDDTLATRLQFSGVLKIAQKQRKVTGGDIPEEDKEYWIIKDEFGARVSCFDKMLADSIHTGETYEVRGDIKIAKGGTYLNLKNATLFNGGTFEEKIAF